VVDVRGWRGPMIEMLYGRADALAELRSVLRESRLTTVTGQAGVGKTRLVDALLAELSDVDPTVTEATFVPLAEVTRPELVVPAIAARLGIVEGRARSPFDRIVEALEKRHHLLVLDNFEHLRSAAGEVAGLIERCPQLRILVTSRVPLRHRPEHVMSLQPLDLPPSMDAAVLVKEPAVAMFADIAERSGGGAAVNEETVYDVAAICRLLEGNPLAIELAAARTNVMGPRQILDLIAGGASLDVLRDGPFDLPSRQRDVTAALNWSYRLLGEREAALLRRLSVFPSWFSFAAAQTISGGDVGSVLDALSALVDAHLVDVDHAAAESRYRLQFTVREFATRELDACTDERDGARRRHLDHTARVATAAVDAIDGPRMLDGLAALEAAGADITAAIDEAVSSGDGSAAARLVLALGVLWEHKGLHLVQPSLIAAVEAMGSAVPPARRAELSGWRAYLDAQQLLNAERSASRRIELALLAAADAARATGEIGARLRTLSFVVLATRTLGTLDTSAAAAAEGIDLAEESGHESWLGRFEAWGGMVAGQRGDKSMAILLGRRALARGRRTEDDFVVIRAVILLQPLALTGDIDRDEVSAAEALRLATAARDHTAQTILTPMAAVEALVHGDLRGSAELCHDGLTLAAATSSINPLALAPLLCLASVALAAGDPASVAELHGMLPLPWDMLRRTFSPEQLAVIEKTASLARRALGDERFELIQRQGSAVPRTEVLTRAMTIAERLADSPRRRPQTPRRTAPPRPIGDGELTPRELDVLRSLAQGGTNKEIAAALSIDVKTAMHHTSSIYRKLGVRGRVEAAAWAWRTGVVHSH
jgi:predicted ATPase/DNA-binding CsgD family transcriptional regulator